VAAHARGSRLVSVTPEAVLIGARPRHVLLLRDAELPLLSEREPALRVTTLASLPGGSVPVGPLLHDYGADPEPRVPDVLHYPPHTLRRYEGRLVLPRSTLVHHRRTVLPDSFRWHLKDELEVAGIRTIDEHFGRLRKGERGRRLDGSYFYFSYNNTGHYGHLMTEALSRLWGWWPAKAEDPSLRILCRLHPTRGDTAAERLETFLLPALGISPEDIVWVDGPVEVESLVGCTPMWHNAPPLYFHPAMLEVWDRLRTGVMREDAHPGPSRLFITRRVGGRPCSNLGGRGALRRPWLHGRESRAAQCARAGRALRGRSRRGGVRRLRDAQPGVRPGRRNGDRAQPVGVSRPQRALVRHGAAVHCFWSRPDADHPEGGFSYAAHQGSWTFDTAGNGPPLRALLACLEH
jgi:hypothetical protein